MDTCWKLGPTADSARRRVRKDHRLEDPLEELCSYEWAAAKAAATAATDLALATTATAAAIATAAALAAVAKQVSPTDAVWKCTFLTGTVVH